FRVPTAKEAPTGSYTGNVRVGGVVFTENFRVETIMPNRLKLNLTIDGEAIRHMKAANFRFQSNWLHGSPARNLKFKVDAVLSQANTSFHGYVVFTYDDAARGFKAEAFTLFEGKLNEAGEVEFSPEISLKAAAPGVPNAHNTARVFEVGGAFSVD